MHSRLFVHRPTGQDTLHGGIYGWDRRNWTIVSKSKSSITYTHFDAADEGFPGNVTAFVRCPELYYNATLTLYIGYPYRGEWRRVEDDCPRDRHRTDADYAYTAYLLVRSLFYSYCNLFTLSAGTWTLFKEAMIF